VVYASMATEGARVELAGKVPRLDAGLMTWTAPQIPRQSTPTVAGERQLLEAWLDYHRQTLLSKCSGLTAEQLRQRPGSWTGPSTTSGSRS